MLRLLTLNIAAAAKPRAQALLEWLAVRDEDLLVLTETSAGAGTAHLLDFYRAAGWQVHHATDLAGERGTALLARVPVTARPELTAAITPAGRAVAVTVACQPAVTVLGVYVPSSDRAPDKIARKRRFVDSLRAAVDALPPDQRERLVLCGDLNVVARDHQPPYRGFQAFEYDLLDQFAAHGLADAHRHLTPGVRFASWVGRGGNAYRFDYLLAGAGLLPRLRGGAYLHEPRLARLTDHAAVTADLDVHFADRLPVGPVLPAEPAALF